MGAVGNVINKVNPFSGDFLNFSDQAPTTYDSGAQPVMPTYQQKTNADGTIQSDLQANPGATLSPDESGLQAYQARALSSNPSPWAQMMSDQSKSQEAQSQDQAGLRSAGANATAEGQLAASGGLSSGARERLAQASDQNSVNQAQAIAAQGQNQRQGIGIADDQQKVQMMGNLPAMQNEALQPALQQKQMGIQTQEFNDNNALNEAHFGFGEQMQGYQNQMQNYAATQMANAYSKDGKPGKK